VGRTTGADDRRPTTDDRLTEGRKGGGATAVTLVDGLSWPVLWKRRTETDRCDRNSGHHHGGTPILLRTSLTAERIL